MRRARRRGLLPAALLFGAALSYAGPVAPPLSLTHPAEPSAGHALCSACHLPRKAVESTPLLERVEGFDDPPPEGWPRAQARDAKDLPEARTPGLRHADLCLSCHDGAAVRERSVLTGHTGTSAGHPIGIDYRLARARRPDDYYDPLVRREIRLDEGRVTCVSCHDPHLKGREARSEGSVCTVCHRL